jgi:hypothetical protein
MTPLSRVSAAVVLVVSVVLRAPVAHAQPNVGQVDDFQNGSTQGWMIGVPLPFTPVNVASGGPRGAGDHYLRLTSTGEPGPGGRMVVINTSQWAGDYLTSGISAITMDVNNLGSTDLFLRLLLADPMFGPPSNIASSLLPVFVPAGSGWIHASFSIAAGALGAELGTVQGALANATELRIFHNPNFGFPGPGVGIPLIRAQLGIDNITAVPEPTAVILFGAPLLALGVLHKRRAAAGRMTA